MGLIVHRRSLMPRADHCWRNELRQFQSALLRNFFWSRQCPDSRHHGQHERKPMHNHQPRAAGDSQRRGAPDLVRIAKDRLRAFPPLMICAKIAPTIAPNRKNVPVWPAAHRRIVSRLPRLEDTVAFGGLVIHFRSEHRPTINYIASSHAPACECRLGPSRVVYGARRPQVAATG
jgi:hypothetical protein